MTPQELNHAVARITGESVEEIKRRGFELVRHLDPDLTDLDCPIPHFIGGEKLRTVQAGPSKCP